MALQKPADVPALGWPHRKQRRALLRAHIEGSPCDWCGQPMYTTPHLNFDHKPLEADHVLPRIYGGTEATRLLHRICNRRRGDGTGGQGLKRWQL